MMKAIQPGMLDADLSYAEEEVATQIGALFGDCPELVGFAVEYRPGWPDDNEESGTKPILLVTDIGLTATISQENLDGIYSQIVTVIADVLSERPEAFELLCGRTFARTLH